MSTPIEHAADDIAMSEGGVQGDHLDSPDAGARFIRGGFWMTAGYGVNLLLSLAAIPFVIRHLGPVGYGQFATVTAVVFIIAGFTEAGLTSLGVREYSNRTKGDGALLLRNLIGLRLVATSLAIIVTMPIMAIAGSPAVVVMGLLVAGIALLVKLMGDNFGIPLSVELRLGWVAVTGFAYQLTLCGGYIVLVLVGAGVVPMLAAGIPAAIVLLVGTGVLVRHQVAVLPAFDTAMWKSMLKETLPFAAAAAVGIIYFREALVLMSFLSTDQQTGYYSAAFRIVEVLTVIPWVLASSGLPIFARAARDDLPRLRYALQRLLESSFILGAWMSASTLVGASLGIAVVAGPKFRPSVPVLEIQGLAIITSFLAAVLGYTLLSLREYRPLLRANAIAVTIVTVLSFALIPAYGATGAAIAPTVAEACLVLLYAWSLARGSSQIRISLQVVPKVAVGLGVALLAVYILPWSSDLVKLIVLAAVYFPLLYVMKAIPPELINALVRRT